MESKQKEKIERMQAEQSFFVPAKSDDCVDCIVRADKNLSSDADIIVAVHGISRSPLQQIAMFAEMAEKRGAVIVSPVFDKKKWRGYQKLFCRKKERRADLALINSLNDIRSLLGIKERRILLYGYSGGGQFAHRFAFFHPEKVQAVALGASGWYTVPDISVPFPLGLGSPVEKDDQVTLDLVLMADISYFVAVGDKDVALDKSLNQTKEVTETQGRDRVERAQNWVNAMEKHISDTSAKGHVQLKLLGGVSHSFRQCMSDTSYVNALEEFFFLNQ